MSKMQECDICLRTCDELDLIKVKELFTDILLGKICLICLDDVLLARTLFPDEFEVLIHTHHFNYFALLKHIRKREKIAKTE